MTVILDHSIQIEATPEQVWAVLGSLTRSPEYIPGIVSARMEDLTRVCHDAEGHEIHEALRYYSVDERAYAVQHVRTPLPVRDSQVRFSVQANGQRAAVHMRWELDFPDAALEEKMKPMLDGAARMTLGQLKTVVEGA